MSQNTSITILEPTTDAATSEPFILGNSSAISVSVAGLTGDEIAFVEYFEPISETWLEYKQNDTGIEFNATQTVYSVWAEAATFRINKEATTNPVGVSVTRYITGS